MTSWPELPYATWADTLDTAPHGAADPGQGARRAVAQGTGVGARRALRVGARHHHRPGAVAVGPVRGRGRLPRARRHRADVRRRRRRRRAARPADRRVLERVRRRAALGRRRHRALADAAGGPRSDPVPRRHDAPHLRRRGGDAVLAGAGTSSSRCSRSTAPRSRARCRASSSSGGVPTSRSPGSRVSRARRLPAPACSTARPTTTSR